MPSPTLSGALPKSCAVIPRLAALLLLLLASTARAQDSLDTIADSDQLLQTDDANWGVPQTTFFALQPPDTENRIVSIAQLRLQGVGGLTIRIHRNTSDKFTADSIARVKAAGDKYTLLVMSEEKTPTEASVKTLEALIAKLGAKYGNDPDCWGVHGTVTPPKRSDEAHGHSEELYCGTPMPAAYENANKRAIVAWAKAFPKSHIILAVTPQDQPAQKRLIDYLVAWAPDRSVVKVNTLSAKSEPTAAHFGLQKYAVSKGADVGFEMLQPSVSPKFGGTWKQAMDKKAAIETVVGREAIYCAPYPPDLGKLRP